MIEVRLHRVNGIAHPRAFTLNNESELDCWYQQDNGFRFNHVIKASAGSANSQQISNPLDRLILKVIRSQADLIVTSGKTAISENLKASRFAPLLVLTNNDEISFAGLETPSTMPVFVTVNDRDWLNPSAKAVGKTQGNLVTWLRQFSKDYHKVVLETGPLLTRSLAPLLNEACITVVEANELSEATESVERFMGELGINLKLMQILEIQGNYFFRFYSPQEN